MSRAIDSKRSKLYRSEDILDGFSKRKFETIPECEKYLKSIVKSQWFKKHFPSIPTDVQIHDGGGMRSAQGGGARYMGVVWMALPKWARKDWVIIHELCHTVTDVDDAAHGREYCQNYLKLIQHYLGREAARALKVEFRKNKVWYKPKRKPMTTEQRLKAIARIQRFQKKKGDTSGNS